MDQEFDLTAARKEISELEKRQAAIEDEDLRLAFQGQIDALEARIVRAQKGQPEPKEEDESPLPTPPSPAELMQADQLLRESKVMTMRADTKQASALLERALTIAPGASSVQEAVGDDLLERKLLAEALKAYSIAIRIDPKNVSLQRKHAALALQLGGLGTLDDQMRAALSDPIFLTAADSVASLGNARWLNAMLPGVGFLVLGRNKPGFTMLGVFLACVGLSVLFHDERGHPSGIGWFFVVVAFFTWIVGIAALTPSKGAAPIASGPTPKERPRPPVNLPFE